jgi:hypothetical protein
MAAQAGQVDFLPTLRLGAPRHRPHEGQRKRSGTLLDSRQESLLGTQGSHTRADPEATSVRENCDG